MNKEKFAEWKSHPATVEVFEEVVRVRNQLKEHITSGGTLGSEIETARLVGNIEGLNQLLNISYEGGDE